MADTLTIRLEERDRVILEAAARQNGVGLSAFIRDLAEAEARRLSREAVRADGERIVTYLGRQSQAQDELETYGHPPIGDLP